MDLIANRYQRVKYIAKGASGMVEHVIDTKTGLHCALKYLRKRGGQQLMTSFQSEFETLKKLNHPHIAKIYDTGIDREKNSYFFTTEFIDGKNLFDATEEMPHDQIEELFIQTLRALNYLHQQGITHYDIKPQNLLVTLFPDAGQWTIKLIDFGFANFYSHKSADLRALPVVGTAAFMPPEIILKQKSDRRADLYALGCTFYKILTREQPFPGDDEFLVYERHLKDMAEPVSSLKPDIPKYWDAVIAKLMAKNPLARYASATAVIDDINLYAGKNYPVETEETLQSYSKNTGIFIGRDEALKKFYDFYDKRIATDKPTFKTNYLIIHGQQGIGKTRLIEEFRTAAQTNFINILSWQELFKLPMDQVPFPCLVLGDDAQITTYELEYVAIAFASDRLLAVFSLENDLPCDAEQKIALCPFTQDQTREVVEQSTGIKDIPTAIISRIHEISGGIPLYLTYCLQGFLDSGLIKGSHGSWSEQMLADLSSLITSHDTAALIRDHLAKKLVMATPTESHWQLLAMLALTGKPTITELIEITNSDEIENELKSLINKGILKLSANHEYFFANPLFKELILSQIAPDLLDALCNQLADDLELRGTGKNTVLYYRSFGTGNAALNALIELAKVACAEFKYQEARAYFERLLKFNDISAQTLATCVLNYVQMEIEAVDYKKAGTLLEAYNNNLQSADTFIQVQSLKLTGLAKMGLREFSQAQECFEQALAITKNIPQWLTVDITNRLARCLFDQGRLDDAEKMFLKNWQRWQTLSDTDKVRAARCDIDLVYRTKKEFAKAIDYLNATIARLAGHENLSVYPITMGKLAQVYYMTGQTEKSIEILNGCLKNFRHSNNHLLYVIYNDLGNAYFKMNRFDDALKAFFHAFDMARASGNHVQGLVTCYNIAYSYEMLGADEDAIKYYGFVIKHLGTENHQEFAVGYHHLLALINLNRVIKKNPLRTRDLVVADNLLEQAQDLVTQYGYLEPYKSQLSPSKTLGKNVQSY